jgi:hypothetical protein
MHSLKAGEAEVHILELLRVMGEAFFQSNEDFKAYCKTVEFLGKDCAHSRRAAMIVFSDDKLGDSLIALRNLINLIEEEEHEQ